MILAGCTLVARALAGDGLDGAGAALVVCSVLPVGAKWPLSVGVHWSALLRLAALECEPAAHGSAAAAPSAQYEPGVHGLHSVCSTTSWKVPSVHGTQVPNPFVLATVPGLHGVCCVLPVGAKWPTPVSVHSLALVRPVEMEYEPSVHGSAAAAPSAQNEPGSQATHACSPSLAWYLPASHLSHVPLPTMG